MDLDSLIKKKEKKQALAIELSKRLTSMSDEEKTAYYIESQKREEKRLAEIQNQYADALVREKIINDHIGRIKSLGVFKIMAPIRNLLGFVRRNIEALIRLFKGPGLFKSIKGAVFLKNAKKYHGTGSFPDEAERKRQRDTVFKNNIKFSILVPLYNTPEKFLREMITSVTEQTYQNWELCLADGSDASHEEVGKIVMEYASEDKRIVYKKLTDNLGISGNTNACFNMSTGDYIALFDHDDVLHPSVLYEYAKVIEEKGAEYLYCDETTFDGLSVDNMATLHFKPDYAVDNLRSNNYICHFSAFSRNLLKDEKELFIPTYDGGQDHDMTLRLTDKTDRIVHVKKLMYYWRAHKNSTAMDISSKTYAIEGAKGAVAAHLNRHGFKDYEITSTKAFATMFKLQYALTGNPKVSVILNCLEGKTDEETLKLIRENTDYKNTEFLILDKKDKNQCAALNKKIGEAKGEYLLFLKGDTLIKTKDYIEQLLMFAQRQDVACVGGKVWRPKENRKYDSILEGGITIGLGRHHTAGAFHFGYTEPLFGYMGKLSYSQNISALTGAFMMVSKTVWDELKGLNENYYGDLGFVDLCLRAREKGYLNVFTPFAEIYRRDAFKYGFDISKRTPFALRKSEAKYFHRCHEKILTEGDPYFNPNMSLNHPDFEFSKKR
ncbi:MAG: glycosyltransferase [Lachnospiraceae bacterium]|nr:glycosyltransferase [Lachnospiraceae bacterium]